MLNNLILLLCLTVSALNSAPIQSKNYFAHFTNPFGSSTGNQFASPTPISDTASIRRVIIKGRPFIQTIQFEINDFKGNNYYTDTFGATPVNIVYPGKRFIGDIVDFPWSGSGGINNPWSGILPPLITPIPIPVQVADPSIVDSWSVPDGEYITKVEVSYDTVVHGLTFVTNKGTSSKQFGGNGGGRLEVVELEGHLV
jgi:hypothetical protein